MSAELIHLSCWALLAVMVVFLTIGGAHTFRELKDILRERRARRNPVRDAGAVGRAGHALRFA